MLTKKLQLGSNQFGAFLTLSILLLLAHSPRAAAEPGYAVRPWPLTQRLNQQTILSVVHAEDGTLWIATLSGIDRFDGSSFTKYRPHKLDNGYIASSSIVCILESLDGRIFAATKDAGLLLFDEESNQFTSLAADDWPSNTNSRISSAFSDRDGDFWIGYESGDVYRYSPLLNRVSAIELAVNDRVIDFTQDITGNLYLGSVAGEIFFIDRDSEISEVLALDGTCKKVASSLEEISAISDRFLWLGTSGSGLLKLDVHRRKCDVVEFRDDSDHDLTIAHIHDVYVDSRSETTWVASDQGLYQIDINKRISIFTSENSNLTNNEIASIERYGDGVLWVGTYRGLNYLMPTVFESYDQSSDELIRSVVAIDSSEWIGNVIATYNGLFVFDPSTKQHYDLTELRPDWNLQNNQIMSLNVTTKGMWVGYRSAGLEFLPSDEGKKISRWREDIADGLSVEAVSSLLTTPDGKIVVGTYEGGLNIFSGHSARELHSIGNNRVIMLYQTSDQTIWVGTESGLYTFDLTNGSTEEVRFDLDSPTKPIVWDMVESNNGVLWFATMHHGLYLWDLNSGEKTPSPLLPFRNTFSTVYSLALDGLGYIWCSTDSGLVRINVENKKTRVFSRQHGLQLTEFEYGVAHKDLSGFLYFGGSEGYTRFDPSNLDESPKVPKLRFNKITFPDTVIQLSSVLRQVSTIQLTHKDYFVQFDFSVLDFLDPEKNEYRYKLEGFDPNWIENGTRNSATYTSLPPGNYTLRIQGANSAGVWNREGLSITVEVLPPPWKTWWAYCCYAALALFFGWLGKRAYDSYVVERRAREMALEMIASEERADDEMQEQLEIHDDLVKSVYRHSVSTLNLVSEVISIKGSRLTGADAREVTDGSIKRVAALALLEDCLYYQNELLLADLHKFTDIILPRLLEDSPVPEEMVTTINEVCSRPFPFEQASPLAIAIYELLENAIQHALDGNGPHYAQVTLARQPSALSGSDCRLTVEDNGRGIPANIEPLSAQTPGLAVVSSMVQRLSGQINYTISGGTLATITFHCADS